MLKSIAHYDSGLNPFRLAIDMIISVFQTGYTQGGTQEFDTMIEAKRVARAYFSGLFNGYRRK